MIKGTVRFNGISIGSLNVDMMRQQLHLEATAAFVDADTGETHGWTKADGKIWSKSTMEKLKELTDSMEKDLAKMHFTETSSDGASRKPGMEVGGIAEHIKGGDAPSI